ncbi:MAG: formylglycine-generating enzyme family protein [Nitrospiraceae bacterium]
MGRTHSQQPTRSQAHYNNLRPFQLFTVTLLSFLLGLIVEARADDHRAAATESSSAASNLQAQMLGSDRAPLHLIPAGRFTMGSASGQDDEQPSHTVELPAFYIDVHEITVGRYARFLKAVNADRPVGWNEAVHPRDDDKPVVGVDWFDAREYCEWVGRRLPTEAEWEKTARGPDARPYPWGEAPPTAAHAQFNHTRWKGYTSVAPVGTHPDGQSPYGIHDLAGNVWEWVSDRYDAQAYRLRATDRPTAGPNGPAQGPLRVLRGGSWADAAPILRSANRAAYPPNGRRRDFGFRCAADARPPQVP